MGGPFWVVDHYGLRGRKGTYEEAEELARDLARRNRTGDTVYITAPVATAALPTTADVIVTHMTPAVQRPSKSAALSDYERTKARYPRHCKYWTPREEDELLSFVGCTNAVQRVATTDWEDVAEQFQRTPGACRWKYCTLLNISSAQETSSS